MMRTGDIVGMHWREKAAVVKVHEVFHRTIFMNTEMTPTDLEFELPRRT